MSTLRINNIEAKSVPASPTLDEKIKLTNSSGNVLVHVDGKTSGITTIGINTTAGNITFDANSNVVVTGIITATRFSGEITPTSLEIGSNIKLGNAGVITATTFSGSGASLTNLPASQLTGALPAISGANLTGLNFATTEDINNLINNVAMLGFKVAVNGSLARYNLVDQVIDEFNDASGIDAGASTNEILGGSGNAKYYSGSTTSSSNTTQTYAYTGSDVTLALNNGQTVSGTVKLWAAAGGTDHSPGGSTRGGGGAFASAVFDYTSDGTDLIFSVGQGGIAGTKAGSGGNGGGYSGVFLGSKTHGNALIVVGAGGGAGDTAGYNGGTGGAFGGNGGGAYTGGGGGQQGAGGAGAGNPFGGQTVANTAGSALTDGFIKMPMIEKRRERKCG